MNRAKPGHLASGGELNFPRKTKEQYRDAQPKLLIPKVVLDWKKKEVNGNN